MLPLKCIVPFKEVYRISSDVQCNEIYHIRYSRHLLNSGFVNYIMDKCEKTALNIYGSIIIEKLINLIVLLLRECFDT